MRIIKNNSNSPNILKSNSQQIDFVLYERLRNAFYDKKAGTGSNTKIASFSII